MPKPPVRRALRWAAYAIALGGLVWVFHDVEWAKLLKNVAGLDWRWVALGVFLDVLPENVPIAFEFRHATWFADDVYALLRAHNVALCLADTDEELEVPLVSTANWGYLRLRRPDYPAAELGKWRGWVQAQKWDEAFVFFKHEDAGAGPKMAMEFLALLP